MHLMAVLLLGEEIALVALVVLLVVIILAAWLCVWLVKRFRTQLGRRAYFLPLGVIIVLAGLCYLPFWLDRPNSGPPHVIPGTEVQQLINHLPADAEFGYAGLGYFKGKLYVATNIGLAEVENGTVVRLFQFQKEHSVVSGPWIDRANQILWVLDDETFELLSFDGNRWKRFPMPLPQKGYYSRGDVLDGVRPVSGQGSLAFTAGDGAWRWDAQKRSWAALSSPPEEGAVGRYAALAGILPLGKDVFLVRHERQPYMFTEQQNFQSDTAAIWNGSWIEIPNHTDLHFFADEWTVAGGVGYICTKKGELLRISVDEISRVNAPGQCESLTTTDAGSLLVSFWKLGIYELTTKWEQRAAPLYPSGAGEYWTHLASYGEEMAYAIEGKPVVDKEKSEGIHMTFTRNAPTHLWLIRDGQNAQLLLPR
jgi:hypothetical protein